MSNQIKIRKMRTKIILLSFFLFFVSCQQNITESNILRKFSIENFANYNFKLLTTDYEFDLKSRNFKIAFYKFSHKVKLSSQEENQIVQLFFKNYIDKLGKDILVQDSNEPMIMPSFGDSFYIYKNNNQKTFIRIIDGEYKELEKLTNSEKNILKFRNGLFKILENNSDFKICLYTLKSVRKHDKRLFL